MRWADRVLLTLAAPTDRTAIFSTAAARALVETTFQVPDGGLQDVTAVQCRRFDLLPRIDQSPAWLGSVRHPTDGSTWLVDVTPGNLTEPAFLDAVARLRVTAGGRAVLSTVTSVSASSLRSAVTPAGCDAFVVARDGALPTDPDALERARLDAAGALLTAAMGIPADFDAPHFFATQGLSTSREVIDWLQSDRWPVSLLLDVVTETGPAGTPLELELESYVLVSRNDPVDLHAELRTVQTARRGLESSGSAQQAGPWTTRTQHPVLLILPTTYLDDDELPLPTGPAPALAQRPEARLQELNRRLRPTGVAVTTS